MSSVERTEFRLRRRTDIRSFTVNALYFSVLLAVIVAGFLFYEANRLNTQVFDESERQGRFLYSTLSFQMSDALYFNNIEQVREDAEGVMAQNNVRQIVIFAENGRMVFDSSQPKIPSGFVDQNLLEKAISFDDVLYRRHASYIEFVGAIRFGDEILGGIIFELDVSKQIKNNRQSLLEKTAIGSLLVLLTSILSFAIASSRGATRSLRGIESNIRDLVEQSPLPYSIYAPDGHLSYVNPAMQRLMEPREETRRLISPGYNILQDQQLAKLDVMADITHGFNIGAIEITPFQILQSDHHQAENEDRLWLKATIFPLRDDEGITREVVLVYEDITTEKKSEQDREELNNHILQSQKLEGLGIMARGIAHDFNNLLTPVLGNADLLEQSESMTADQSRMIRSIKTSAVRASELCDQMLTYGRESNEIKTPTDLSLEITEMSQLIRSSVSRKIHFSMTLASNLPLVMADQTQLRSIILNLLINASESIENSTGEIVLKTGTSRLGKSEIQRLLPDPGLEPGEYVYLSVADSGIGMGDEILDKLFNPFFSTKFAGRGLGMSAVLGIVGDHEGGIAVRSEPEKGSLFTIYLPAYSATRH